MGEGCSCSAGFTIFNLSDANGRDALQYPVAYHKGVSCTVKCVETRSKNVFFCRFLQVCEMCRLYRSCAVQAVFGSLSCMTPHGSHFGPDHPDSV